MATHVADEDVPIVYNPRFREYGIKILDGGTAVQLINFCPWCGSKLPGSMRNAWFRRLDELKVEPGDERIPDELKSDAWWKMPREKE